MMTSGQIAGMMGQQNQMFAGAAAYSQQISQQMPGAYGAGMGQTPAFAQVPGGMQQQGGFSYGGPQGQNLGNRMGGSIVSGMGGAAQFGMGAVGIAAGFGMMGKMGAPFDPFIGGGMGWRAGGAAGRAMGMGRVGTGAMRLGMGAMGMLPAAGLMMAGQHIISSTMAGAQEQSAVENVLSRQRMGGAMAGGQGFTSNQAKGVGDMMRGMQALPEMMTSMSELTRIMDKMGQMGVMQGAQDVAEFKTKFKQNIKLLKDMSKVMSTSMEEALPMFGEIRRSGFYSTGDILKNAMNRQLTSGLTGMNQRQVSQVAQYGAQVNWQRGGTLKAGAQHGLRTAQQLGAAKSLGLLTEEQISEATGGIGGAEGIQMMSQRMTSLAHKMSQGSIGLATSVALGAKDKSGRFTGEMDENLMKRYRSGEFSFSDIKRMANQAKQGRQAIQSWATNKGAMRASLASGMGVEGTTRMLQSALGGRGFNSPDHMRLMAQRFGMSERDTNTYLPLMQKMPEIMQEARTRGRHETKRLAQEAFMKENYSWDAVKTRAKKRIASVTTEPLKRLGADIRQSINETVDDFVNDITGQYKVEVTKGMTELLQGAMSGRKGDMARYSQMMDLSGRSRARSGMGGDFSVGRLGEYSNILSGNVTAGQKAQKTLRGLGVQSFTSGSKSALRNQGIAVLDAEHGLVSDTEYSGMRQEDIDTMSERLLAMGGGQGTSRMNQITSILSKNKRLAGDLFTRAHQANNALTAWREPDASKATDAWIKSQSTRSQASQLRNQKLQAKFDKAGLGNVNAMELTTSALGIMGESTSSIRRTMLKEGKFLGGFLGQQTSQELAKTIEGEKLALRGSMEDTGGDFDAIMAAMGGVGADRSADLLFGTPGGAAGLLSPGGDITRTKGLGRLAGGEYAGIKGADWTAQGFKGGERSVKEFESGLARKMGSDRLAMMKTHGVRKGRREWRRSLDADEKRFFKANKEAIYAATDVDRITSVLQQIADGKDLDPDDVKALKAKGMDVTKLSKDKAQQFLDLKGKAGNLTEDQRIALKELNMHQWEQGMAQQQEDLTAYAQGMSNHIASTRASAHDVGLKIGDDANDILNKLTGIAGRMELMAAPGEEGDALRAQMKKEGKGWGFGAVAADVEKLKGKQRSLVLEAGEAHLSAAFNKRMMMKDKMRGKGDITLEKMFGVEGWGAMGEGDKEKLLELVGPDKTMQRGEREGVLQFMSEGASSKTISAAGITQKVAHANPADVAASMNTFVGATDQLAKFVQKLATGEATTDGKPI